MAYDLECLNEGRGIQRFVLPVRFDTLKLLLDIKNYDRNEHKLMFIEEIIMLAINNDLGVLKSNADRYLERSLDIPPELINTELKKAFSDLVTFYYNIKSEISLFPYITITEITDTHLKGFMSE